MILKDIMFLTGFTARGRAYAQAMTNFDLLPEWTFIYGDKIKKNSLNNSKFLMKDFEDKKNDIFYPDLNISIENIFSQKGLKFKNLQNNSVNEDQVIELVRKISPKLVIFSGYGGEIVSSSMLKTAPFLHIHSGWLPDFRGSTCIYYSLLEKKEIGVSAILLDKHIDTGKLLARKLYKNPSPEINIDYCYDTAIRADLLIKVLNKFKKNIVLKNATRQPNGGRTFYVIHPILKHLAKLSLK